jgi:hypothetical protein
MTRAIQKHIARRQDQTFADWFAELRELAGERWLIEKPAIYAVWSGGPTLTEAIGLMNPAPAPAAKLVSRPERPKRRGK